MSNFPFTDISQFDDIGAKTNMRRQKKWEFRRKNHGLSATEKPGQRKNPDAVGGRSSRRIYGGNAVARGTPEL